jgi:hypothetical protein
MSLGPARDAPRSEGKRLVSGSDAGGRGGCDGDQTATGNVPPPPPGPVKRVTAGNPSRFDSYMALSAQAIRVSALRDSLVHATPTLARSWTGRDSMSTVDVSTVAILSAISLA